MKYLIFDASVSGHHLEYLHHYYEGAIARKDDDFIIMVPHSFDGVKNQYEWPKATNISVTYIAKEDERLLNESNFYKLAWNVSKLLRKAVLDLQPDRVVLTMLMQFIPFIIFLLPHKVRVRGIMYKIYLYDKKSIPKLRLAIEIARLWLASRSKVIEKIFVLNDECSANALNRIYKTHKFSFLPDPVPDIELDKVKNIRDELGISSSDKVFLHFGSLDYRKGTVDILKAIIDCSEAELRNCIFIFAGKICANIKNDFYLNLKQANQKARIIVFDRFCEYEFLYNLCFSSDVILMPYYLTSLSSGVLGYAALFKKQVIGPNSGLIGRLIGCFGLGSMVDIPLRRDDIFKEGSLEPKYLNYTEKNCLRNFIAQIFN